MSDGFVIRLAEPADLTQIGDITVRGYANDGFLAETDDYANRLRNAADRAAAAELWVAVDSMSGQPLGSVTFCPLGSTYRELADDANGEFRMLAVDPTARGRGIGRALVVHCLDRSRALGFAGVVLCSLPDMTSAHALYLSLGFQRDADLDWSPVSDVVLWGFRITLGGADARADSSTSAPKKRV